MYEAEPFDVHVQRLRRFASAQLHVTEALQLSIDRDHPDNIIAKITAHQRDDADGIMYLRCRWRGFTSKLDSWQTAEVLVEDCPEMVVKYINTQQKRDRAIQDLVQQHFPDLDRQNAVQARKRIPGEIAAGKRRSRGRVGRTLRQQNDHDAMGDDDVCEESDNEEAQSQSNEHEGGGKGKTTNRSRKQHRSRSRSPSVAQPRGKQVATVSKAASEQMRQEKNRERDERRRRRANRTAGTTDNTDSASERNSSSESLAVTDDIGSRG